MGENLMYTINDNGITVKSSNLTVDYCTSIKADAFSTTTTSNKIINGESIVNRWYNKQLEELKDKKTYIVEKIRKKDLIQQILAEAAKEINKLLKEDENNNTFHYDKNICLKTTDELIKEADAAYVKDKKRLDEKKKDILSFLELTKDYSEAKEILIEAGIWQNML